MNELTPVRCATCGAVAEFVNYPRLVDTVPRCYDCQQKKREVKLTPVDWKSRCARFGCRRRPRNGEPLCWAHRFR